MPVVESRRGREGLSLGSKFEASQLAAASVHRFVRIGSRSGPDIVNRSHDRALPASHDDVQARRPATHLSLSRVGVTGVEKVIRIRSNGREQLFYAELECFVDLGPEQKGRTCPASRRSSTRRSTR